MDDAGDSILVAEAAACSNFKFQICDDLVQVQGLEAIVISLIEFNGNAAERLRKAIRLVPIFSWGTACSKLVEVVGDFSVPSEEQANANLNMRQNHDPRFATNNLFLRSYEHNKKCVTFTNAVAAKDNPRVTELHQMGNNLEISFLPKS